MGVAQYRISPALPARFEQDLPTFEELAREFPLMTVVKLRIEIERALREYARVGGFLPNRPTGIGVMLREFQRRGVAPPSTDRLLEALRVMNDAVHGVDVNQEAADRAVSIGTVFLTELKSGPPPKTGSTAKSKPRRAISGTAPTIRQECRPSKAPIRYNHRRSRRGGRSRGTRHRVYQIDFWATREGLKVAPDLSTALATLRRPSHEAEMLGGAFNI